MRIETIFHVVKKEIKELKNNRAFIMYYLYIIILTGVVLPLFTEFNTGIWGVSMYLLIIVCFIGIIIPSTLISDSFAGEKERKTLETLISTPITITALYLGKVFFAIIVTECIIVIVYISNLIVYNVISLIQGGGFFMPFNGRSHFVYVILSFAVGCFISFFGSILSIHTKNVKSCNLLIMLVGSPTLVPIFFLLNQETVMMEAFKYYAIILIGVAILAACYVKIFISKVTLMVQLH